MRCPFTASGSQQRPPTAPAQFVPGTGGLRPAGGHGRGTAQLQHSSGTGVAGGSGGCRGLGSVLSR